MPSAGTDRAEGRQRWVWAGRQVTTQDLTMTKLGMTEDEDRAHLTEGGRFMLLVQALESTTLAISEHHFMETEQARKDATEAINYLNLYLNSRAPEPEQ